MEIYPCISRELFKTTCGSPLPPTPTTKSPNPPENHCTSERCWLRECVVHLNNVKENEVQNQWAGAAGPHSLSGAKSSVSQHWVEASTARLPSPESLCISNHNKSWLDRSWFITRSFKSWKTWRDADKFMNTEVRTLALVWLSSWRILIQHCYFYYYKNPLYLKQVSNKFELIAKIYFWLYLFVF